MEKKSLFAWMLITAFLCTQCAHKIVNVEAGVQNTSIDGQSESWRDPIGAQIGMTFNQLNWKKVYSLDAGIIASMQGAKYRDNGIDGRVNLLYVYLPWLLRYQSPGGFYAELGVQPGYLISAKDKYLGMTYDYKDEVKKIDVGIPAGIGYVFKNKFGIGARVIEGITNINTSGYEKDHNFVMALRLTYNIKK